MDQKCTHQNHSDTIRFYCKNLEQEKMKQDIFRYICIGGCGSTFHSSFPFNGSGDAVSFPIVFSPFHFILLFRSYITFITTIIILIIIKPSNAVVSVYSIAFFCKRGKYYLFTMIIIMKNVVGGMICLMPLLVQCESTSSRFIVSNVIVISRNELPISEYYSKFPLGFPFCIVVLSILLPWCQ